MLKVWKASGLTENYRWFSFEACSCNTDDIRWQIYQSLAMAMLLLGWETMWWCVEDWVDDTSMRGRSASSSPEPPGSGDRLRSLHPWVWPSLVWPVMVTVSMWWGAGRTSTREMHWRGTGNILLPPWSIVQPGNYMYLSRFKYWTCFFVILRLFKRWICHSFFKEGGGSHEDQLVIGRQEPHEEVGHEQNIK